MTLAYAIGVLAALTSAVLACYAYLALHRETIGLWEYALLNAISCVLGLMSLFTQFNLGSLLVEVFFGAISLRVLLAGETGKEVTDRAH